VVDIHSHILPSIDDGATSWEMAEKMCALAASDGITHIVATPHASHRYHYDREAFGNMLADLQNRVKGGPMLLLGCDFHLSYDNVKLLFADPSRYVIAGTRYILLELSDFGVPPGFGQLLFRMRTEANVLPILTHPERNPIMQRHPDHVLSYVDAGCLVQVTANSLTGYWGERAKDSAVWLLKKNAVHFLATDAHGLKGRLPILSAGRDAAARVIGRKAASQLVEENPLAVIEGAEIPMSRQIRLI